MVEATGIEPVSENHSPQLSPSAACLLGFPSLAAVRQAASYGSLYCMTRAKTLSDSRSPLNHAPNEAAVLSAGTAAFN